MAIQGLNSRCSIYRDVVFADDDIGGAVPTKLLKYSNVKCRVSSVRPTQMAREAGLETPKLYNVVLQPAGLDIRENDYFYLTLPTNHELYHVYIPIEGVQIDSISPADTYRRHMELTLSRIVRSRTE
jgi:hypothetical protein